MWTPGLEPRLDSTPTTFSALLSNRLHHQYRHYTSTDVQMQLGCATLHAAVRPIKINDY